MSIITDGAARELERASALEERVLRMRDRLSVRRRELLQRILTDADETFFLSLRRLAQRLAVNPATLTRTIQALGYEGFHDFAQDLRHHFVTRVTPYSVMRSTAADDRRTLSDHVEHSILNDLDHIAQMRASLDTNQLESAARMLCQARRVVVVGLDLAYSLSYWLAYSLTMIGINAEAPQDRALLFYKTQLLTRDDVLVAISYRRCMKATVDALIAANEHKTPTLAITDSATNPLGSRATISLLSSIESPVVSGSIAAPIALLNALVIACSQQRASHTLELLKGVHDEYKYGDRWYPDSK